MPDQTSVPVTSVSVATGELSFPPQCCCCGAPAERSVEIERKKVIPLAVARITKRMKVQVPCCAACERNVKWYADSDYNPIPMFVMFMFLGVVIVGIASNFVPINKDASIILGFALGIGLGFLRLRRRRKKRGPQAIAESHICQAGAPVFIRRFDRQSITFAFLRDAYAQQFAQLNGGHVAAGFSPPGAG